MKYISFLLLFFFAINCSAQSSLNFKPYTNNINLAGANEATAKQLLEISIRKFLLIANDSSSKLNKKIQNQFAELRQGYHPLESYRYPKKLIKECISAQFVDWTALNGLHEGPDSAWNTERFTALIFVPLMTEEPRGNSVQHLCFKTELEISHLDKTDRVMKGTDHPAIAFKVEEIDLAELKGNAY